MVILLMAIGNYWWLNYYRLLMDIVGYFIVSHWWLSYWWLSMVIILVAY
jgi:hypothetical protein